MVMGMEILLLGALIVGLPLIIACFVSYWREKKHENQTQQ